MKRNLRKITFTFMLFFLLITLVYVSDIDNIPSEITLFKGETLKLNTIYGVDVNTEFSSNPNIERIENNKTITVTTKIEEVGESEVTGTVNLSVKLLGIKVKNVNVNIIENTEVIPIGNLIGVKLYTNGVLVVGMSEISGMDSNKYKPYEGSGIEEGDVIVEINKKEITSTKELTSLINKSKGKEIDITYVREGNLLNTTINAVKSSDNSYKIGLWVRDTAAGVGTATFYEPKSKKIAALGHRNYRYRHRKINRYCIWRYSYSEYIIIS